MNEVRATGRRGLRLFAGAADEPRARRATDGIVVVCSMVGLGLLSLVAVPQAGFERALVEFLDSIPSALDGIWQLLADLLVLAAVVLIVAAIVRRRGTLVRDFVLAVAAAFGASLVVERWVEGSWPAIWDRLQSAAPPAGFPPLRVVLASAVVLTALPQLSRSVRWLGRWLVGLGAAGATLLGASSPSGAIAAVLLAVMVAAAIHLIFGSPRGRPSLDDVATALDDLGVGAASLGVADRQPTGLFLVDAQDLEGNPLVVKVFGRDALDTQRITTLWRTIWYRETDSPIAAGRIQQVEHEAFLTLLAGQAGLRTQQVVTAGATIGDDVVLVLRPVGQALSAVPHLWTDATVNEVWQCVELLQAASIAHGQIDDDHLIIDGQDVGLIDFRGGTVAPTDERRRTDEAQALVTTVLAVGEEPALRAASRALGRDRLAAVLPFVQMTALTDRQRGQVREAGLDLDGLRDRAATLVGMEVPELHRLQRVTWGSLLQVGLLAFAFFALATAFGGLDLQTFFDELSDARWWFVAVGLVVAQLPRFTQAISALGASPVPLALGPVYALQLAQSYVGLAVPTAAARVGVNIRFFQRHGLPPGSAVAIGAIDGFSGFIVQALLLVGLLVFTPASLELDLSGTAPSGLVRLMIVIAALAFMALVVLLVVPKWRRAVLGQLRQVVRDAIAAVRGLQSPRRLGMILGGSLGSELLFATALGAFALALGFPIGLDELLLINISVSLLAGLLPVPGGIGVVEGGLTFGLVRAGMPEEAAFAAALMYRMGTFYLPPIWGFFALKWLERNKYL